MKTFTFLSANKLPNDQSYKVFEITVKEEFLLVCPDPESCTINDLFQDKKIVLYFYNPFKPTLSVVGKGYHETWINGKRIDDKEEYNYLSLMSLIK